MNEDQEIQKLKCVFVGDLASRKSEIINLVKKTPTTVGVDFAVYNTNVSGKNYKISLWDTAGQERFRAIYASYLRDAQVAFVCFSYQDSRTLKSIEKWQKIILDNASTATIKLLGYDDKSGRIVANDEVAELADKMGLEHYIIEKENLPSLENILHSLIKKIESESKVETKAQSEKNNSGFNISSAFQKFTEIFTKPSVGSTKKHIEKKLDELSKEQDNNFDL